MLFVLFCLGVVPQASSLEQAFAKEKAGVTGLMREAIDFLGRLADKESKESSASSGTVAWFT